jgi:hypothetical protein
MGEESYRFQYCVRCGYRFLRSVALPPVPCRCGAMDAGRSS